MKTLRPANHPPIPLDPRTPEEWQAAVVCPYVLHVDGERRSCALPPGHLGAHFPAAELYWIIMDDDEAGSVE